MDDVDGGPRPALGFPYAGIVVGPGLFALVRECRAEHRRRSAA